jgi:hypothetical protein
MGEHCQPVLSNIATAAIKIGLLVDNSPKPGTFFSAKTTQQNEAPPEAECKLIGG